MGTTTYTYWPNGLPKDVTENGRTTHREYDSLNRLSLYQDGEGNMIGYGYHPSGELASITYPGNKTVNYTYDDFGRLWHVTDWASRVTTYTYDNASRLTRIDRPNGTYRVQEYDAASQMRFIKEYKSTGSVFTFQELRYDADGRITSNFIHPKPPAITLAFDDLLYDADNRLSTWNGQGVTFDADGNMTTGPLPSGAISANNYGYDSRNRLTSAGGSGYRYSPDGARVEITGTGAATFVIDPNAALSRTLMRTKGGVTTYYVYGLGLLYEETAGATKTYHADQIGSTLAITNDSQTVTDTWTYSPYGTIVARAGSTDTPFQFNGEMGVQTDASGLLHMRARYYNPRLMRFVNADPIGFSGGMNWYAFAGNDPVSRMDPFGLKDSGNSDYDENGRLRLPTVRVTPGRAPNSGGRSTTDIVLGALGTAGAAVGRALTGAAVDNAVRVLPIGQNNQQFLADWMMGRLPAQVTYGPNSQQTTDMRLSPGADVMRTQFNAAGGQNVRVNYGTGQAFIDTIANPFTANWSGTGMQVGGFGGATVRNNGDGTATFTINNVAGTNSFFYHIAPNNTSPTGPMHNVTQTFIWTEPVNPPPPPNGGKGP